MKQLKYMSMLVLLCCLSVFCTTSASAAFDANLKNGVVNIIEVVYYDSTYMGAWTGTGFFVGSSEDDAQYIVTNYHVVETYLLAEGNIANSRGQGSVIYAYFDETTRKEAYIVGYDVEKDLAILRLENPTDLRISLALLEPEESMSGASVTTIGYPSTTAIAINSVESFVPEYATVSDGVVSNLITESGTGRRVIQTNAVMHGGNSGGPLVLTEESCVIGVNTFGYTIDGSSEGLYYAMSVVELLPLLNLYDVPYRLGADVEPEPTFPIIPVAIAAVVLLLALVVCIVVLKKKNASAPPPVVTPPVAPPVPPQPILRSYLYSSNPQHAGVRLPISPTPVLLGRNPSSGGLVYNNTTRGVSSTHCSVSWDESKQAFVVTDLKSSYGTFTSQGVRLQPHQPITLQPGSTFYLGDSSNTCRVTRE